MSTLGAGLVKNQLRKRSLSISTEGLTLSVLVPQRDAFRSTKRVVSKARSCFSIFLKKRDIDDPLLTIQISKMVQLVRKRNQNERNRIKRVHLVPWALLRCNSLQSDVSELCKLNKVSGPLSTFRKQPNGIALLVAKNEQDTNMSSFTASFSWPLLFVIQRLQVRELQSHN